MHFNVLILNVLILNVLIMLLSLSHNLINKQLL
jgi:hypothetical protein